MHHFSSCSNYTTRVYSDNINHDCTGGCPDDCVSQDDVLCYTEYYCKMLRRYFFMCVNWDPGPGEDIIRICYPWPESSCPQCYQDDDVKTESYVEHRACE